MHAFALHAQFARNACVFCTGYAGKLDIYEVVGCVASHRSRVSQRLCERRALKFVDASAQWCSARMKMTLSPTVHRTDTGRDRHRVRGQCRATVQRNAKAWRAERTVGRLIIQVNEMRTRMLTVMNHALMGLCCCTSTDCAKSQQY